MPREMIQNEDGSFFIYNRHLDLPTGARHTYRDEELGWDVDGKLGILRKSSNELATIEPIIVPLTTQENTPNYDLTLGELELAKNLGGLVNCYAFQAEIVRDESGKPLHLSTRTHITLLKAHEDDEGEQVLEPVVTLLNHNHPAHPYYEASDEF